MTTARQRAANRRNAVRSTGPRSGAGRRRSAANARRHGLEAGLSAHEVAAALGHVLARLGRSPESLSPAEGAAAEALARAGLYRARVRHAEHGHLVALDSEDVACDPRRATDEKITALLDAFRDEGVAPQLLEGLGPAAGEDAGALNRLLRHRCRAERAWRTALRQWMRASHGNAAPGPEGFRAGRMIFSKRTHFRAQVVSARRPSLDVPPLDVASPGDSHRR